MKRTRVSRERALRNKIKQLEKELEEERKKKTQIEVVKDDGYDGPLFGRHWLEDEPDDRPLFGRHWLKD